ncbi:MAG: RDD family protein [Acidobacteria bacterium]|nr:RDD family protein [Acidobacteriota bacterium]
MSCLVCERDFAAALSVCPTCGSMRGDTVREEMKIKRSLVGTPLAAQAASAGLSPSSAEKRSVTSEFLRMNTSPTLVEFQTKSAPIPEWRLQLQNAVRARKGMAASDQETSLHKAKASPLPKAEMSSAPDIKDPDPRLAKALKRVDNSRSRFLPPEPKKAYFEPRPPQEKSYRFDVLTSEVSPAVERPATVNATPRPALVPISNTVKRETNKLPKLEESAPKKIEKVEKIAAFEPDDASDKELGQRIMIAAEGTDTAEDVPAETEFIDDLAPIAMRFNAGLFDLLIALVVSMLLLSPIVFGGGEWASVGGFLALIGTTALVLFIYSTLAVGFYGRTFGMHQFSLELVDAEENAYPTLRQSAVSAALYLVSLMLSGLGFVTIFFNEEKRAVHDLLSGTIMVREFVEDEDD